MSYKKKKTPATRRQRGQGGRNYLTRRAPQHQTEGSQRPKTPRDTGTSQDRDRRRQLKKADTASRGTEQGTQTQRDPPPTRETEQPPRDQEGTERDGQPAGTGEPAANHGPSEETTTGAPHETERTGARETPGRAPTQRAPQAKEEQGEEERENTTNHQTRHTAATRRRESARHAQKNRGTRKQTGEPKPHSHLFNTQRETISHTLDLNTPL